MDKKYFISFNDYLKSCFSTRVYKVSVDAGFTCPNRDGTKSKNGCIFCDNQGSSSQTNPKNSSIENQIKQNIKIRKSRYRAKKFIVYFQSFSNTYDLASELKKKYDRAICVDKDIVGLSISTRPDCVDEEKIKLISEYKKKLPYVCIEYGLQTTNQKTLKKINRQETLDDFLKAFYLTKKYGLNCCVHIILGLPGEEKKDYLKTADTLASLKIQGVKIHFLVAMKNTQLEKMYKQKLWIPHNVKQYVTMACDFIERLHKDCIIHRLSKSGHPNDIVAPIELIENKVDFKGLVSQEFKKRGTKIGFFCKFQ